VGSEAVDDTRKQVVHTLGALALRRAEHPTDAGYLHHGALDDMKGFSDPEVCLQLEGQGWRALQPVLQLATLPSPAGMLALSAAAPCSAVCCT